MTQRTHRALMQGPGAAEHHLRLAALLGERWQIDTWQAASDDTETFERLAAQADVIVGGSVPIRRWPATPRLKLYQVPWTGHEFLRPDKLPAGVPACNAFEHETAIAEYVLLAMLEWRIGLRRMDERWRKGGWNGRHPTKFHAHGEVAGATVGIVGYGHIGEQIATRAAAFGMRVVGTRRRRQPTPAPLDWLGTPDDLHRLLEQSDFVVLACDLNDATRGLIDASALAKMRPDAVLVNVARGAVVDENALFEALRDRRIGGAVIDCWYRYNVPGKPEVWPSNLPFQELDNVLLSAHESAATDAVVTRRWRFVADNLERAVRGEPLHNVLFEGAQTP